VKRWEFINDYCYPKVGDAEVLYSIVHAVRAIRDERVKELFLNAARHLKEAEGVRRMREFAMSLDKLSEDSARSGRERRLMAEVEVPGQSF
jgi:hypothetical protein